MPLPLLGQDAVGLGDAPVVVGEQRVLEPLLSGELAVTEHAVGRDTERVNPFVEVEPREIVQLTDVATTGWVEVEQVEVEYCRPSFEPLGQRDGLDVTRLGSPDPLEREIRRGVSDFQHYRRTVDIPTKYHCNGTVTSIVCGSSLLASTPPCSSY